jgi:hypothetical protein
VAVAVAAVEVAVEVAAAAVEVVAEVAVATEFAHFCKI